MGKDYSKTQEEICSLIERVREDIRLWGGPEGWNNFCGDVCVRIFREFMIPELPAGFTLSLPNAYTEGCPAEFDLLMVREDALPRKYTNQYAAISVILGIEIKTSAFRDTLEVIRKKLQKIKLGFDRARMLKPDLNFAYITYEEQIPVKANANHYLNETIKGLSPYKVFCLRNSRTKALREGEWRRVADYLKTFAR